MMSRNPVKMASASIGTDIALTCRVAKTKILVTVKDAQREQQAIQIAEAFPAWFTQR